MLIRSNAKQLDSADLARFWRAVRLRDARMDGILVYAVRSTGVYCLPSCPARRPQRDSVLFFSSPAEAESRGFRACKRCWPQRERHRMEADAVRHLSRLLENQSGHFVYLRHLSATSARFAIRPTRLKRSFQQALGVTPRAYADHMRISRLKLDLRKEENVTTSLYKAGFGSSSRLYERSNGKLGMTPATYGKGGRNMQIHYTITPTAIGRVLVAGTDRGICAVYLGRSDAKLIATLRREYPHSQIAAGAASLASWVRHIVRHLAGKMSTLDLPLDICGTAFQRRVWDALRRIPYGQTRSYTEIARQLGKPQARRAVARACATNPVSLVIPCHRVVRSDGELGGYGGGIENKRKLLERERLNSLKAMH